MNYYTFTLKTSLIILTLLSTTTLAMEGREEQRQPSPTTSHKLNDADMATLRAELRPMVEHDLGLRYLKEAEEDYKVHYKTYHTKALQTVEAQWGNNNHPRLTTHTVPSAQDLAGHKTAIANFKLVMNENPIPPEIEWTKKGAIRGWVKKYNLALVDIVNASITQQKKHYREERYMEELEKEMLGIK
jgi:hypothetical protein